MNHQEITAQMPKAAELFADLAKVSQAFRKVDKDTSYIVYEENGGLVRETLSGEKFPTRFAFPSGKEEIDLFHKRKQQVIDYYHKLKPFDVSVITPEGRLKAVKELNGILCSFGLFPNENDFEIKAFLSRLTEKVPSISYNFSHETNGLHINFHEKDVEWDLFPICYLRIFKNDKLEPGCRFNLILAD